MLRLSSALVLGFGMKCVVAAQFATQTQSLKDPDEDGGCHCTPHQMRIYIALSSVCGVLLLILLIFFIWYYRVSKAEHPDLSVCKRLFCMYDEEGIGEKKDDAPNDVEAQNDKRKATEGKATDGRATDGKATDGRAKKETPKDKKDRKEKGATKTLQKKDRPTSSAKTTPRNSPRPTRANNAAGSAAAVPNIIVTPAGNGVVAPPNSRNDQANRTTHNRNGGNDEQRSPRNLGGIFEQAGINDRMNDANMFDRHEGSSSQIAWHGFGGNRNRRNPLSAGRYNSGYYRRMQEGNSGGLNSLGRLNVGSSGSIGFFRRERNRRRRRPNPHHAIFIGAGEDNMDDLVMGGGGSSLYAGGLSRFNRRGGGDSDSDEEDNQGFHIRPRRDNARNFWAQNGSSSSGLFFRRNNQRRMVPLRRLGQFGGVSPAHAQLLREQSRVPSNSGGFNVVRRRYERNNERRGSGANLFRVSMLRRLRGVARSTQSTEAGEDMGMSIGRSDTTPSDERSTVISEKTQSKDSSKPLASSSRPVHVEEVIGNHNGLFRTDRDRSTPSFNESRSVATVFGTSALPPRVPRGIDTGGVCSAAQMASSSEKPAASSSAMQQPSVCSSATQQPAGNAAQSADIRRLRNAERLNEGESRKAEKSSDKRRKDDKKSKGDQKITGNDK